MADAEVSADALLAQIKHLNQRLAEVEKRAEDAEKERDLAAKDANGYWRGVASRAIGRLVESDNKIAHVEERASLEEAHHLNWKATAEGHMNKLTEVEKRLEIAEKIADEAVLFERAATKEINEKGAGGYALARLSDLRGALKDYKPATSQKE